ncbi:MAG: pyridoxamine 5'-phosphate oxidase family protein [Ardenticatenaceae bacterium]|nr:pyridoxamine 5'-phosphate oxidase family protein [Ardenticatenaceae bacterium]
MTLSPEAQARLASERNIWLATVRPDGRPHLVPLWFAWHDDLIYICIQPGSVKATNLRQNPLVSLSLEDGSNVVICEGETAVIPPPPAPAIITIFQQKYNWDITTDKDYTQLIAITPHKWLSWGGSS